VGPFGPIFLKNKRFLNNQLWGVFILDKSSLLKTIALKGYDVGFGAKKHFATFDMSCKLPDLIALITLTIGVIQLGFDLNNKVNKFLSVILIFMGIVAIFINKYRNSKSDYEMAAVKINKIYYKLRELYYKVKETNSSDEKKLEVYEKEYNQLINDFNETAITQQLVLSDWYAHYKFFVQLEIKWIEEQRPFRFRDKVPLLARYILYLLGLIILIALFCLMLDKIW